MLRTKGLAQAQSTRLYISFLVIQDHIESIGKANTIKRGWGYDDDLVAQVLSDIVVGERSNFKKIPTHTQDHGDA